MNDKLDNSTGTNGDDFSPTVTNESHIAFNSAKTSSPHESTESIMARIIAENDTNLELLTRQPSGKYRTQSSIGQGGMKAVLKVEDKDTCRDIAMAVMVRKRDCSETRGRFVREARIAANLEHPNIVPVYDIGLDDRETPYFTMKMIGGENLSDIIDKLRDGVPEYLEKYTLPRMLEIFQKICDAVAYAHSKKIVHLDLKPENIQVGDFGEVLVLDWGLAKPLTQIDQDASGTEGGGLTLKPLSTLERKLSEDEIEKTKDGVIKGTPGYMAPEQALGKNQRKDQRTDIYALGGVLYSLLTWEKPIEGDALWPILSATVNGTIIPPRHRSPERFIPPALEAVTLKAMRVNADERYQTAEELRKDIDSFIGGYATMAEEAGLFRHVCLLIRRHKSECALIFASLCLVIILTSVFMVGIIASERRATSTLKRLKATAPVFVSQARTNMEKGQFDKALSLINAAVDLAPEKASYHSLKGNILQSTFQFEKAEKSYENALVANPNLPAVKQNIDLCERLANSIKNNGGTPDEAALRKLYSAMLEQRRLSEAATLGKRLNHTVEEAYKIYQPILTKAGHPNLKLKDGCLYLDLNGQSITDLSAFKGIPLGTLLLQNTAVSDLSPLKGMPLKELRISHTKVRDLTPLRGIPLELLDADQTRIEDFAPLEEAPLKHVTLSNTPIKNLDFLKNKSLTWLNLQNTEISDLHPLKNSPLKHLRLIQTKVKDLSPLAGMPLNYLNLAGTRVTDINALRGTPLKELSLTATNVKDLAPLHGMPLERLDLTATPVDDLSPLRGMALWRLSISGTPVNDISALKGMPLRQLFLQNCPKLRDLSPLRECDKLEYLVLPQKHEDINFLRKFPKLRKVGYDSKELLEPDEFWNSVGNCEK